MGEWGMVENKVDILLFDINYIKVMVLLSKMMRWWNYKIRVLGLYEKIIIIILYILIG